MCLEFCLNKVCQTCSYVIFSVSFAYVSWRCVILCAFFLLMNIWLATLKFFFVFKLQTHCKLKAPFTIF